MLTGAERLRAVRQLYRGRSEARTTADMAYAVYAIVLGIAVVAVPAIHALFQALAHPAVLPVLEAPASAHAVALLCGVGLAAFAAVGAVRGPALLSPFLLTVFANTDIDRHRTLRRPFVTATVTLTTTVAVLAVLVGSVLVLAGTATAATGVWFTLAATAYGVLLSVVWLVGQSLGSPRAGTLAALISAATLLTWVVPSTAVLAPWGWVGLSWPPGASPGWWPPALLGITALVAAGFIPKLLNALRSPVLLEQAHRWQTAEIATGTADFAGALATYRPKPRVGRAWRAVTRTRVVTRFFLRDLTGALRTPARFAAGTAFLLLGGFVTALTYTPAEIPTWAPAAAGAALSYAALGVFTDGLRHAAETAAAPPLYRYSTAGLYGLHAVLPTLWAIACTIIGLSLAPPGVDFGLLSTMGCFALFVMAARVYDSTKGPLPPMLLTPIPTPAGDLSGLLVIAWQADALLIVTITTAAILTTTGGSALAVAGLFLLATMTMVALTRQRLRNL